MIFDEAPRARAPSGERVPSCAYPRFCQARKLALALGETGLRRAIEVAPEELLKMTIRSMGLQPKNQKAYGLLRARIAQLPKPPLHCITWMLAASPIVSLADIVDAATDLSVDDIANGVVVEAEIEKAMREGAIEEWTEQWPATLLAVAVETMWDQGYFGVAARDEFLERLRSPLPPEERRSSKPAEESSAEEEFAMAGGQAGTDSRPGPTRPTGAGPGLRLGADRAAPDAALAELVGRAVAAAEAALATGADPSAALAGLEWLLQLDPASRVCWLAYGRIAALLDRPELASPPAPCRGALTAGRILGLAHRGDSESVIELSRRPEVEELLASPPDPLLVSTVLGACLAEPRLSARLLGWVGAPFEGWERYVASLRSRSEELLAHGAGSDVETLLGAAEECLSRWDAAWPDSEMTLSPEATTISLLRVSARRRVGDFVGAARLMSHIDRTRLGDADNGRVRFERAMVAGELRSTDQLALDPESDRRRLVDRLERARPDLDLVLETEPHHEEANLARGILAALTGDDPAAVWHLSVLPDAGWSGSCASTIRFHLALSRLRLLEPQTSEGAQRDLVEAVEHGYVPSTAELVSVVEALDAHGSQEVGAWLARSVEQAPTAEPVTKLVVEHARGPDPMVRDLAETMGGDATRKLADRFDLLAAALAGAESVGDSEAVDRIVGALDEVVTRVNRAEIDDRWADMLGADEALRTALEPAHADALRIDVLRRCGRHPEAVGVAKALFYRAAAGSLGGFDAVELLEVVGELGEEADELQRLSRLVRSEPGPEAGSTAASERSVRILFVGGNESQEAYRSPLDLEMAERYEGKVGVEWFFSGWTSNWNKVAERVESSYDGADAVVLMTFVRTNFGRWVRRTTGERGLPWIACTGHGRTALAHAIHRAVQVARARSC